MGLLLAGAVFAGACSSSDSSSSAEGAPVSQIAGDPSDDGVASALSDPSDESFPAPLIDLADIRSGGPPPDGIPPIDEPEFAAVDEIDFIEDNEPVLLVEIEGDTRVYPVQIMTWHEIVNDTVGGVPVTVSYCPLCNSAVTYRREVGDRVLDFGTSGSLFNSSLIMYDRQTESLWTHFDGRAVVGALTGTQLEFIATSTVSWSDIVDDRPDAMVLTRNTGHERRYGSNPYEGYDNPDGRPFRFEGATDDRLLPQTRVVTVVDDGAVAIAHGRLTEERAVAFDFDDRQLVALLTPGTSSALDTASIADGRDVGATGVFAPTADDGTQLTLTPDGDDAFTDAETGSTWSILGEAVAGPLQGEQLEAIPHLDTFWFAAQAFRPDIEVLDT